MQNDVMDEIDWGDDADEGFLSVVIEDERWDQADLAAIAETACAATLNHLDLSTDAFCLTVMGCDDTRIKALNADHRAKDKATNVLSWPSVERGASRPGGAPIRPEPNDDWVVELGDIAIAYETCVAEADDANKPLSAHITHLLVHATLHLLGYDHISDADAALMEGLEVEILATLGIDDPYR